MRFTPVNQIWSIAGQGDRATVRQLFVHLFFIYNWKSGAGTGVVGSITKNWESRLHNWLEGPVGSHFPGTMSCKIPG